MEKKDRNDFFVELEQEENRIAHEHYRAEQTEKEMSKLRTDYEGLFYKSTQLFLKLEKLFHKSQTRYVFTELFSEVKREEQDIFERIDGEKAALHLKKKELEQRENEIYYEKRRLKEELR
ncbi:DUF3958 family protein [Enterococcus larvae]|uniref:DUF3958 family protein n=1 Tax=Enterococcus larvae TaxID=2794352 RepID=UPI003F3E6D37